MTKRIHAHIIHAWAEGATIQYYDSEKWVDCADNNPSWCRSMSYRVKPKPVFKWIALYDTGPLHGYYDSLVSAERVNPHAIKCVRVQVSP